MSQNKLIWIGFAVGSTIGGFIPGLWGDSSLSFSSILFSAIGGIMGIYAGFRLNNW